MDSVFFLCKPFKSNLIQLKMQADKEIPRVAVDRDTFNLKPCFSWYRQRLKRLGIKQKEQSETPGMPGAPISGHP
jgi:hypothetical protein